MSKISQWQSISQSNGQSAPQQSQGQQAPQSPQLQSQNQGQNGMASPLANYTLPGVISYLTSEFTSLERFKIMTNLEKSEMKCRITQLQGEVNSLKLSNEQQKLQMEQLERENASLRAGNGVPQKKPGNLLPQIPEIDLQVIKDSRYQLTKSMKEVIHLLRSPVNTNLSYLELPNITDSNISLDDLLQKDDFSFTDYSKPRDDKQKKSVVGKFFTDDESLSEDIHSVGDSVGGSHSGNSVSDSVTGRFGAMNITDSALESDTETVILDGGNDLKFNTDGEIEPDIDLTDINSPPSPIAKESAPKLIETQLSLAAPGFNKVKVFRNPITDFLLYLHYDNEESPDSIQVSLFDVAHNSTLADLMSSKSLFDDVDEIVDLFCTSFDKETQKIRLLSVRREGTVNEIIVDGDDSMTSIVVNLTANGAINRSTLIEFDNKRKDASKAFGLAVSLASKTSTIVKVFEIVTGARNSIVNSEIGSYVLNFFKIKNASGTGKFEVLKWFKSDTFGSPIKSPTRQKTHRRTSSTPDASLSPFNLLLKYDTCILSLNIVSKQHWVITDYASKYVAGLEANEPQFIVSNPPGIHIYSLSKPKDETAKKYDLPLHQPESTSFTFVNHGPSNYIFAVTDKTVTVYDENLNLISSNDTLEFTACYRVGHSIALEAGDNLKFFSLF